MVIIFNAIIDLLCSEFAEALQLTSLETIKWSAYDYLLMITLLGTVEKHVRVFNLFGDTGLVKQHQSR